MLEKLLKRLEHPKYPLLGPNIRILKFFGLLLPKNLIKRYFYLFIHLLVTFFVVTECIDVYYVKSDISLLLINLKVTMLATVSVFKIATFLKWQKHFKSIIKYITEGDSIHRTSTDETKQLMIAKYTKYCRKVTYLLWSLMCTTIIVVIFQPVALYFSSPTYRFNVKNGTETYLQVISSWVPFDKNTMPGYLSASVFQSFATMYGGGWITTYDTSAIVMMVYFRAELELLKIDCRNIFGSIDEPVSDEEAKERMKKCHKRYVELLKYSSLFESCLSPVIFLYMFVCTVMLCVTSYQITNETSAMQRFLTTEYLVFGVAQLFMYCWHSNDVLYASLELRRGPYESTWWMQKVSHRQNLFILIAQFSRIVVFSAGPFTKLTVSTFITIVKGAYSFYTLLNQSQMN